MFSFMRVKYYDEKVKNCLVAILCINMIGTNDYWLLKGAKIFSSVAGVKSLLIVYRNRKNNLHSKCG